MTDATATEQAKEQAQQVAGQAQEKAQEAAGKAKSQLQTQVDQRSTDAGRRVNGTAGDLKTVAQTLREQGSEQPAKLAEQAAEKAERLGGYLEESDAERILGDVEDYARRQPWVVGLGAAAVGFAAARFMKASSSQRYQGRSSSSQRSLPSGMSSRERYGGDGPSIGDTPATGTPTSGTPGYTAPITSPGAAPGAMR
jgi:hypothetical protein